MRNLVLGIMFLGLSALYGTYAVFGPKESQAVGCMLAVAFAVLGLFLLWLKEMAGYEEGFEAQRLEVRELKDRIELQGRMRAELEMRATQALTRAEEALQLAKKAALAGRLG